MKSQQVNKVDLSLDDIIRMDGLGQPQEQNRGGNNRSQGSQHNKRQGQGQRGLRTSGQHGGGNQGLSGVSPLNRDKQGSSMNTVTNRGQMAAGDSSQRTNGRSWTAKSAGGGGRQWGGQGFSGGNNNNNRTSNNRNNSRNNSNNNRNNNNNNMRRQANNRPFNFSRLNNSSQGNGPVYYRGQRSNNQQSSLQRRGIQNSAGGIRQDQQVGTANQRQGSIGQDHGQGGIGQGRGHGGGLGQGNLRIRVGQTGVRGQGQIQQGLKQIGFEEKRRMAMQALREARKTIAQLDQQAARQNVVNTRRGISPQPSAQLPNQGASYQNVADDNLSLASDSSMGSSSPEHDLMGRHITSFNMNAANSGNSLHKNKQWQHKPLEEDHLDSTLTISIDNSAPFVSHSELPQPPESFHSSPPSQPQHSPSIQAWTHLPGNRRPTYQPSHNSRLSHSRHSPYHQPVSISRRADNQPLHWQPQEGSVERTSSSHSPNLRRGATPGFSRQLAQLKPTVPMRYMFQKKTFSAASTPVSLNDRFSEPEGEDAAGRKVFM